MVYDKDHWHCEVTTDEVVGALLAEIEAAGYSLVKTDRLDELQEAWKELSWDSVTSPFERDV